MTTWAPCRCGRRPQADDGGSFRLWKSPSAFAKLIPEVTLGAAQGALGESEGGGVLPAYDTAASLRAVSGLMPAE
jgi:hypothetical protein